MGHFIVTFKQCGWYLNFSVWFVKNVLFEHEMINNEINGIFVEK